MSLFSGGKSFSLASLRYSFLAKKLKTANTFVTLGGLPTTISATNVHSRRIYLQVMEWLGTITACNLLNVADQRKGSNLSHA